MTRATGGGEIVFHALDANLVELLRALESLQPVLAKADDCNARRHFVG